ncbi:MAG TPA: Bax inhibitor-1/YccA family protein [Thermoanaerobaculia bacterium]|nr:Bax inhibitor-1/YccA family protein [Thermoanaerobaculia bacterium]
MSQFPYRPEQPAWVDGRTADVAERERTFIRSVYAWMFGGLILTALSAMWVVSSPAMQQLIFGTPLRWVLLIAELGLVFYLSFRITKMSPASAASVFLVFALLNGLTLSSIFFVYTAGDISLAFFTAAGMFGAMSVYGMVTKRDLTSWGSFFFMGLIGILICGVVNIFLKSSALGFAISLIGVFVFLGLTAYDTQKLKSYATSPTLRENLAVYGALALYLDFINLFLMLLRLFGGNRR